MQIKAKYPGKCRVCGNSFAAGELIEWSKGSGAQHPVCKSSSDKQVSVQRSYSKQEDACELCGKNRYTCGHCIGW